MAPPFRILLVEDSEPFRRFVREALQPNDDLKIIGEALDGLEAIQKAKNLQPDLILLDIGLPKLNGLAAAERIRILAPHSKLLFVSFESSAPIVREALRLGAHGYVWKLKAPSDLEPAIEAVLAGKQFVSRSIGLGESMKPHHLHEVQFCSDDTVFLESVNKFISTGLQTYDAAIVIATKSHRQNLLQRLKRDAFDVDGAIQQGTFILVDVAQAVSEIMVNNAPDRARFLGSFGRLVESCGKATQTEHPRVAIFGECAPLLCAQGNTRAAVEVEQICNDLFERHRIDVLCAYPLNAFDRTDDDHVFRSICAAHTAVFSR